ncbi:MAG: BspA family leucine-rich repeat surface protein [Bacteroidota bacterium]
MKRLLLFLITAMVTFMLAACGDSSTGPDSGNDDDSDEPATYTVSVDASPSDAGSITPDSETEYEEGKEIQVYANAEDDYVFTGWTGDVEFESNPLPLTVNEDYNLTANFEKKEYELTVDTKGEGTVQEQVVEEKSKEYEDGTVVELTASPAEGYRFVEWTGDVEETDNPAQVTVDDPKEVTAVFEKKDYKLNVRTDGSGAVSEQVISKAKDYEYGDVVELDPSAAEGWEFVEWKDDLEGSDNPAQVTVDTAKTVTAVFERKTFALAPDIQGEGSVAKDPDESEYEYGSKVTLTADPDDNWDFKEWAGEISGTTPEISVTVHSERDIKAFFKEEPLFYTAKNGETVVCPEAEPGDKGILNGEKYGTEYEAVDRSTLEQMIDNGEDVTRACTTPVTDMSKLLEDTHSFNQDISNWDVSNVTAMDSMFVDAEDFNADIGSWDVSNVTNMERMFLSADVFNQDIGSWDVSSVTDMNLMFSNADAFNQDIGDWDVRNVTDMSYMFRSAEAFNQDIGNWDVSNVTDMEHMFDGAEVFNGDISGWDVSKVTDMSWMFRNADAFDQDIGNWDVSNVTTMGYMFYNATIFNHDLTGWCVEEIDSDSGGFNGGSSALEDSNTPDWGNCP